MKAKAAQPEQHFQVVLFSKATKWNVEFSANVGI